MIHTPPNTPRKTNKTVSVKTPKIIRHKNLYKTLYNNKNKTTINKNYTRTYSNRYLYPTTRPINVQNDKEFTSRTKKIQKLTKQQKRKIDKRFTKWTISIFKTFIDFSFLLFS